VAIDGSGNLVMAGQFQGTADFGLGALTSAGSYDIFVAKYTAAGAPLWAKRFGSSGSDYDYAVAVDGSGNVLLAGAFSGTVNFGGGSLTSAGNYDLFVAKFSPTGAHLWSRRVGGTGSESAEGVAVDPSGNVVVAGAFQGTVDFGGGAVTSAGDSDLFVAKYAGATGAYQWARRYGGTGGDFAKGVAVDGSGNVAVAGYYTGTADFGAGPMTSAGNYDIVVAKYAGTTGAPLWARRFGGAGYDLAYGVAVDGSGNVMVTGYFGLFGGAVDFGGGARANAGAQDIFVAKYAASNGAHLWSRGMGGGANDQGNAVAVDRNGDVLVTGYFGGTVNFGTASFTTIGMDDIFVAKYAGASGAPVWARQFGGWNSDKGYGVVADASGNVAVTGYYEYQIDFGGGPLNASNGSGDGFLLGLGP
jgi:hypothetical protein